MILNVKKELEKEKDKKKYEMGNKKNFVWLCSEF
jgi:hypothetical protein